MSYHQSCNTVPQSPMMFFGREGTCGKEEVRVVIGHFTQDVHIESAIQSITFPPDGLSVKQFFKQLLSINTGAISFKPNAQLNQICTFHVNFEGSAVFGGKTHLKQVPFYCNVVHNTGSIGIDVSEFLNATYPNSLSEALSLPKTFGQYGLQINPFLNAFLNFAEGHFDEYWFGVNIFPFLSGMVIKKDTPIYRGTW